MSPEHNIEAKDRDGKMDIELVLHKAYVQVFFKNTAATELHLWDLWNSWGYWSVSFEIRSAEDATIFTIKHIWNSEWTVNSPTTFTLAPGEKRAFSIDLNDGQWMRDHQIASLKDKSLLVRVNYGVDPMESDEFNFLTSLPEDSRLSDSQRESSKQFHEKIAATIASVFTGSAVSDWVISKPPHDWLFMESPQWTLTTEALGPVTPEEMLRIVLSFVQRMASVIELNAKEINREPIVSLPALATGQPTTNVGNHLTLILEYAQEIQKAVQEAPAYLERKLPLNAEVNIPSDSQIRKTYFPPEPQAGDIKIDDFGITMVYVPAGKFLMGSNPEFDNQADENEYPQHEIVFAQGFWIDQFIVTNEAYSAFIDAGGYQNEAFWTIEGWRWRQNRQMHGPRDTDGFTGPKQPRVGVTWFEASAYSAWRGGRLPTEAEWEYAARGPRSLIYPWGNEWNPDFPRHEWNSAFAIWFGNQGKRALVRNGETTVLGKPLEVGSRPRGKSWVNAQDMAGNAWEWCANSYKPYPYKVSDGQEAIDHSTAIVLRGGSWDSHFTGLRSACRHRFFPDVEGHLEFSLRPIFSAPY